MTIYRTCQFHLTSDRGAVVEHHPQAKTEFAKEQGYIILRFEAWVGEAARDAIVAAMNSAHINAHELRAH